MQRYLFLVLFTTMLCAACADYDVPHQTPELVVEGIAEAGSSPVVRLTTTVPVQVDFQSIDNLQEHVLRYARVTVSDGEESVILTGRYVRGHRIPFEYTTGHLTCQAGKTYTLTVDYLSYHAEAQCFVPAPCSLDSLYAQQSPTGDLQIVAIPSATDAPQWGRCFICSSVTYGDFLLAPLSMLPASRLLLQNPEIQGQGDYSLRPGEEVIVRCSSLDSIGNLFWTDYEQSLHLSRNYLMPLTDNVYSNVDGALGYWLGLGSTYYRLVLPE